VTGTSGGALANRQYPVPPATGQVKVVRGRDGWLFLDFDTNHVMAQVHGRLRMSAEQLRQWQLLLENRAAWLAKRGAAFFFLVAPVPHVVFPDKLPEGRLEGERPMLQLMRYFDEQGSYARVVYPAEQLVEHRDSRVYTETNTHWTDRGAFVAYQLLSDEIAASVSMRKLDEAGIEWLEVMQIGDLGCKLEPAEQSLHICSQTRNPKARLVYDNGVFNEGRRAEFECDAAPDSTCLVLGTSSAHGMVHLLAEGFRRLVFTSISTLDYTLVEEVNPDVVITIFGERFMIRVPVDIPAPTQRELEAGKRAAGRVFPAVDGLWRTRLVQPAQ
jgi:alginate O-acetyltransferase complex protein AlgJ